MKTNYHTHTYRCHHASGTEEQYIQNAIKNHIQILGFADHTPWHYASGYHPTMRMEEDELDGYINTLLKLKEKYKEQIEIKIGLECEYFPSMMDYLKDVLKTKPIDYIILGNHFYQSDETGYYFGSLLFSKEKLKQYVDTVIEAIDTNLYTYIAHPDLVNYYDKRSEIYKQEMTRLIKYANKHNMPLEFNLLGYKDHRQYPNPIFWSLVSELNGVAIIGYDAHDANSLLDDQIYQEAREYLESLNIKIIETIEQKD